MSQPGRHRPDTSVTACKSTISYFYMLTVRNQYLLQSTLLVFSHTQKLAIIIAISCEKSSTNNVFTVKIRPSYSHFTLSHTLSHFNCMKACRCWQLLTFDMKYKRRMISTVKAWSECEEGALAAALCWLCFNWCWDAIQWNRWEVELEGLVRRAAAKSEPTLTTRREPGNGL